MDRTWNDWAPLPLRIAVGIGMMVHGYPKLFSSEGHEGFVGMLSGMGIPAPGLMAWVVGVVEFFGGLALLLGAFVLIAGALVIVDMLVAIFMVHLPNGFLVGDGGYELALLYLAGTLSIMLSGAGALSVDRMMRNRRAPASPPRREPL